MFLGDEPTLDQIAANRELVEKIGEALHSITPDGPKIYRLDHQSEVRMEVDGAGMGHTYIGDVDVSSVTQAVTIETSVGHVTKIKLDMIYLPAAIKAIGVVEITSREIEAARERDEA